MKTNGHRIGAYFKAISVYPLLVHPLLFLGFASDASIGMAQSSGTFTATGNMTTARDLHTATLLQDGRVLIAGGFALGPPLASAELYDPATGTFAPTGNIIAGPVFQTATLLADGRVLLFGSSNAELYDPATGTFIATGPMTTDGCAAALLGNGKVLIVGNPPPYGSSARAELYDPDTGLFSPTGPYASIEMATQNHILFGGQGGSCPKATVLPDGRVLIAAGVFAELYDPGVGTFSITGTKITFSNGFVKTVPQGWLDPSRATLLLNGMVLFDGGGGEEGLSGDFGAWLYNPSSGTFTATGNIATSRVNDTGTLLPDGTVLVAGGYRSDRGFLSSVEIYDPVTGSFSAARDMTMPRLQHAATLLNSGKVLIAGGFGLSSAELYTPAVLVPAPVLLSLSGDGKGQGAIQHAGTYRIASVDDPAVAGEYLSIYLTGLAEGSVIPPQIAIGGRLAEITFFGNVPGYPGLNVVNVRTPVGVAPGPAVSVRLTYLGRTSNAVTIGAQ